MVLLAIEAAARCTVLTTPAAPEGNMAASMHETAMEPTATTSSWRPAPPVLLPQPGPDHAPAKLPC